MTNTVENMLANLEFQMDYDQLTLGQKEWVQYEMEIMTSFELLTLLRRQDQE